MVEECLFICAFHGSVGSSKSGNCLQNMAHISIFFQSLLLNLSIYPQKVNHRKRGRKSKIQHLFKATYIF